MMPIGDCTDLQDDNRCCENHKDTGLVRSASKLSPYIIPLHPPDHLVLVKSMS